eukprot:351538-Chlamydomonas_euryale.AAC.5
MVHKRDTSERVKHFRQRTCMEPRAQTSRAIDRAAKRCPVVLITALGRLFTRCWPTLAVSLCCSPSCSWHSSAAGPSTCAARNYPAQS